MRVSSPTQTARPGWKETLKVKCPHCGEVHGFPSAKPTLRLRSKMGPTRLSLTAHPECCLGSLRGSSRANQQNASTRPGNNATTV